MFEVTATRRKGARALSISAKEMRQIHLRRMMMLAVMTVMALMVGISQSLAHDRPSFADLAEKLSPAVVNISTTTVLTDQPNNFPQFPPGSPFEDFLEEFLYQSTQVKNIWIPYGE